MTALALSKLEPPIQNGRVGTYVMATGTVVREIQCCSRRCTEKSASKSVFWKTHRKTSAPESLFS